MKTERRTSKTEPLSESEKRHFSLYEKQPLGYLLDKRFKVILTELNRHILLLTDLKDRTYFDSGDFALSAGERAIETGAIESGCEHPNREKISHPNAPVPSNSNVDYGANRALDRKSLSPERKSLLHYETGTTDSK
ncbi:hypothetical protein N7478_012106 [Penicillium angulare]|uniref:uncharacterized protein n=1 Tax=Penicillium angulare TaxID=116970 RepID=UPI002541E14E|nr:uncharacterized protein N7478_012106 [Penicillium angulare]KAJ5260501.1 hypothetical protein N7478_012106 [Penicillium angulare]